MKYKKGDIVRFLHNGCIWVCEVMEVCVDNGTYKMKFASRSDSSKYMILIMPIDQLDTCGELVSK